ncbi:MAG: hypothetical protein ACRC6X_06500 [Culicoidibacterales bacterium]
MNNQYGMVLKTNENKVIKKEANNNYAGYTGGSGGGINITDPGWNPDFDNCEGAIGGYGICI